MSLLVWLPLNGNLKNQGVSNLEFIETNNTSRGISINSADGKICQKYYERKIKNTHGYITSSTNIKLDGDISMCCWCKITDYGTNNSANGIITYHSHESGGPGITMKYISDSDYRISFNAGTNSSNRVYNHYYGNTNIYNEWHHLCLTYERATQKYRLYVDGKIQTLYDSNGTNKGNFIIFADAIAERPFNIFDWSTSYSTNANYRPVCQMNDVRLYNHLLSEKEIKETSKGLTLHYTLRNPNAKTNLIECDCSGYNNNGTINSNNNIIIDETSPRNQLGYNLNSSSFITSPIIKCSDEYTISVWAKIRGGGHLVDWRDWNNSEKGYQPLYFNGSTNRLQFYSSGGGSVYFDYVFTPNIWYHIVIVVNKGNASLYVNGEYQQTITYSTPLSGNTPISYIQSTGSQYINTGYKATSENFRIKCKFNIIALNSNTVPFGGGASTDIISSLITSDSNLKFYVGSGSVSGALSPIISNTDYEMDCYVNNGTFTVNLNGAVRSGSYSGIINKDYPLYIFANNVSGTAKQFSSVRIYEFQIYDNNKLVRYFIPSKNSNGIAGFYDIVNNIFHTNAGTGSFTEGPAITNSLITNASAPIRIGARVSEENKINASISDFRLYQTPLSENDIKELYLISESLCNNGILIGHDFINKNITSIKKTGVIESPQFVEEKKEYKNIAPVIVGNDSTVLFENQPTLKISGLEGKAETYIVIGQAPMIQNHIYYAAYHSYQTVQQGGGQIYWPSAEPSMGSVSHGIANRWNRESYRNIRSNWESGNKDFRLDYDNSGTAGTVWYAGTILIDLTEEFGSGNEPTKEWCDLNFTYTEGKVYGPTGIKIDKNFIQFNNYYEL